MNQRYWFILLTAIISSLLITSTLAANVPAVKPAEAQSLSRAERNWEYVYNDKGLTSEVYAIHQPDQSRVKHKSLVLRFISDMIFTPSFCIYSLFIAIDLLIHLLIY